MRYKRNRTETLTIRLTPLEKQLLKKKAAARGQSITDYILLSALEYHDADLFIPVLETLAKTKNELLSMQENETAFSVYDALNVHEKIFDSVTTAITNHQ